MRTRFALLLVLLAPSFALAQTAGAVAAVESRLETLRFVAAHFDPASGAFKSAPDGKPSLRATTAGVRAFKYLGAEALGAKLPAPPETFSAFVRKCYDPETGGFADAPGGKPDLPTTAVGVMIATDLKLPAETFPKALDYLTANAKTFEERRIAAAALEARGLGSDGAAQREWVKAADAEANPDGTFGTGDGAARTTASVAAMKLRLGFPLTNRDKVAAVIRDGQRPDGAWGKAGEKGSDLETTYRVVRALVLLKEKPADPANVREFVAKCRNADSGYGVAPGSPSSIGAVYYAAIVTHWLGK